MIAENGLDWKRRVCATGCIRHEHGGDCEFPLQAHHVITQQQLRNHGLNDFRWDTDNGICLCEKAHRRHTLAVERIPYELLPDAAIRFAYEHGVDWLLDRNYPSMEVLS